MCLTSRKTAGSWVKIFSHHKVQVLFQASFPHLLNMFLYFGCAVFAMLFLIAVAACNYLSNRGIQKGQHLCACCMADTRSLMNKHQIYVNLFCDVHMLFIPFPIKTDVCL
jgi:hypothetical protein